MIIAFDKVFRYLFDNSKLIFIIILLFYVTFPTNNSSLDSFAYAAYIKYNHYLFTPHHLFSNVLIYTPYYFIKLAGINLDILHFSKIINSIFQILNLIIFYKILSYQKIQKKEKLLCILILAFSFSLWRYGTENEAYIVPIFFSLLSSFYFLKSFKQVKINSFIFFSSFFGVIACLFHQIHFFWWLGLLIGFYLLKRKITAIFTYIIPAALVPLCYVLILVFYEDKEFTIYNLVRFVFNDFYQGSVETNFSLKVIFFQLLNTIRTYVQIHPNIYILIKNSWLYIIPLLSVLFLAYVYVKEILKNKVFIQRENQLSLFINVHVFIFILNYLFAFYNYGNIEFMVMLPYILILIIVIKFQVQLYLLKLISLIFFIWNLSYGIFPNNHYKYFNDEKLVEYMINNPKKIFVVKNATTRNEYFYRTGISDPENIMLIYKVTKPKLDSILNKKNEIFTDVVNKPEILNKEKITSDNRSYLFDPFNKDKVFSYKGLYGKSTIYKISKK